MQRNGQLRISAALLSTAMATALVTLLALAPAAFAKGRPAPAAGVIDGRLVVSGGSQNGWRDPADLTWTAVLP